LKKKKGKENRLNEENVEILQEKSIETSVFLTQNSAVGKNELQIIVPLKTHCR
jgi:hypothetical protein